MRKIVWIVFMSIGCLLEAQNLEFNNGKDVKQPGRLNPALVGSGEDLIRIISDFKLDESAQFMLEGRMPFKLGSYMVGVVRTFTEDVSNNMFNITYGRKASKKGNDFQWRYGGSLQFNQKSISVPGYDSTAGGYTYRDLNGDVRTLKSRSDFKNGVDYVDIQLGLNMSYKDLILGASIENFLGQDVSLIALESRKVPFTANVILGGFLSIGEKWVIFPSALLMANEEEVYTKATLDLSADKLNFTAAYILENNLQDLSASIGYRFKKTFAGIQYVHPISGDNTARIQSDLPSFNLFLNSTLFKNRDVFKSDFAKKMRLFY